MAVRIGRGVVVAGVVTAMAGCSSVTVQGRVVDGLTGEPIAGPYRIKARATTQGTALTCQFFDAPVAEDGTFELAEMCTGTAYALETDRDDLWLVEIDTVPEGGFGQPTDLTAWRVPKGSGVYELSSAGQLTMLRTASDVEQDAIFGTDQIVKLPKTLPEQVDLIGEGEYLVLVGKATIDDMKLVPMLPSGPRKFGEAAAPYTRPKPWWYMGTRFTDDTTFERVEAQIDSGKVVDKSKADRQGRFVAGSALPPGRYALLKEGDKRMFVLDFGAAPPPLPEAPAEPDAAASPK